MINNILKKLTRSRCFSSESHWSFKEEVVAVSYDLSRKQKQATIPNSF
jgi:hypothetical protein